MSEILGSVYTVSVLIEVYILSQLYSHYTQNCSFGTFWRLWKLLLCDKSFYLSKRNFHNNWGMVDHRKLPDLSLNHILNVLSVVLQHFLIWMTWFLPEMSLVTVMPEGQSSKVKGSVCNISISEISCNVILFLDLKRKVGYSWECIFKPFRFSGGIEIYFLLGVE